MQPWAKEELQLLQTLENTPKIIQQTQKSVDMVAKGPATEKMVQHMRGAATQSLELVLPLQTSVKTLKDKTKDTATTPQSLGMSHMCLCWGPVGARARCSFFVCAVCALRRGSQRDFSLVLGYI